MRFKRSLLAKLGLFAPRIEALDPFTMRLDRINMRESRRTVRLSVFRALHQPLAA